MIINVDNQRYSHGEYNQDYTLITLLIILQVLFSILYDNPPDNQNNNPNDILVKGKYEGGLVSRVLNYLLIFFYR
jgi:hypothetical protein